MKSEIETKCEHLVQSLQSHNEFGILTAKNGLKRLLNSDQNKPNIAALEDAQWAVMYEDKIYQDRNDDHGHWETVCDGGYIEQFDSESGMVEWIKKQPKQDDSNELGWDGGKRYSYVSILFSGLIHGNISI